MRFLSCTLLFRVVVAAAMPLGHLNRLSLHVMGLSPNSRASTHSIPSTPAGGPSNKELDLSDKEVCASPRSLGDFPSLSSVFDCRGGQSTPPEDTVRVLGTELSLFGLKMLLQLGLTFLNFACWWVPMRTKSFSQNDNLLALANTFSAGDTPDGPIWPSMVMSDRMNI